MRGTAVVMTAVPFSLRIVHLQLPPHFLPRIPAALQMRPGLSPHFQPRGNKKHRDPNRITVLFTGGEGGIRTLETLAGLHDFQLFLGFLCFYYMKRTIFIKIADNISIIEVAITLCHL